MQFVLLIILAHIVRHSHVICIAIAVFVVVGVASAIAVGVASTIAIGVSSAIAVGVASAATIGYACTAHCLLRHEGALNEYSFNIYRRQLYYYKYNRILLCDIQKSKNRRFTARAE